jgi:RNA polymerase sigma factor (sigma-70 family)
VSPRADRRARAAALAETLYSEHLAHLLGVAARNVAAPSDAEEALQEAILIFIEKAEPDEIAEPLAWLTLVLKRECWALWRKHRVAETVREADDEVGLPGYRPEELRAEGRGPDELAEISEQAAEIRAALSQLKPQEREVLGLLAVGYSYKELREILGYTHTKINRCASEGRARLRELGLDIYKSH